MGLVKLVCVFLRRNGSIETENSDGTKRKGEAGRHAAAASDACDRCRGEDAAFQIDQKVRSSRPGLEGTKSARALRLPVGHLNISRKER